MDREIAGYRVLGEIGRGGMGVVFRALARDGSPVAIKLLARKDGGAVERFRREERLQGLFGVADGFVPLLDAGDSPAGAFIVMPLLTGGTLRDRLSREGKLAPDEVVTLGVKLALALGRAHAKGIVHRDMKPENVLHDGEGVPLVADLGLAKHFRSDAPGASLSVALSKSNELRGTAGYMPAEQMRSARDVAASADVFALGAILYECLSGRAVFTGSSLIEVVARIETGDWRRLEEVEPGVEPWLAAAIHRALSRDPAARYQDGAAFAAALATPEIASRRGSPRRALVVLATSVALIALASGALAVLASRRPAKGGAPPGTPSPPPTLVSTPPSPPPPRIELGAAALDPKTTPACRGFLETKATRLVGIMGRYDWKHADYVTSVAVSADGSLAASGSEDETIHVWDTADGRAVATLAGHRGSVLGLAFGTGGRLLSAGWDGTVRTWDLSTGRESNRNDATRRPIVSMAVTPDRRRVLLVEKDEHRARVLDSEAWTHILDLDHDDSPVSGAFSPDGRLAVTGTRDGVATVWDLATGDPRLKVRAGDRPARAVAFSADGQRIAVAGDEGVVRSYAIAGEEAGREKASVSVKSPVHAVAALDGLRVLAGLGTGALVVVDLARSEVSRWPDGHGEEVSSIALSDDKRIAVSGSGDGSARVWDVRDAKELSRISGHRAWVRSLAFTPDGRWLISGGERDAALKVWDMASRREIVSGTVAPGAVAAVAISRDGSVVASGGVDGFRIWGLVAPLELRAAVTGKDAFVVNDLALARSGEWLVAAAANGMLRAWEWKSRRLRAELDVPGGSIASVALSSDERQVLVGQEDGGVSLWDLEGRTLVRRLDGHAQAVFSVRFTRDGERALTASRDGTARLHDLAARRVVHSLAAHSSWCFAAELSPDERSIVTGGRDGKVRLYSAVTAELLDTIDLGTSRDFARTLAFSPDGKTFAVGTARGVVLLFELR